MTNDKAAMILTDMVATYRAKRDKASADMRFAEEQAARTDYGHSTREMYRRGAEALVIRRDAHANRIAALQIAIDALMVKP
jgi:hypothetical protein